MADAQAHRDSGPQLLAGLRVVEVGGGIAAPLVGMLLAEHGAEVVRCSSCDDDGDPVLDAILARGKTEAKLCSSTTERRELLEQLLSRTDVLVASHDDTSLDDIDLEQLRCEHNPGLVSCRISPFPAQDSRARELPGYEAVAGASGYLYSKPIGIPQYHNFPIGSLTSSLYAANAVIAALIARTKHGWGQHIDTCYLHGNLLSQVLQIFIKAGVPRGFLPMKMIGSPAMRCWKCRDERYVYLHITMPSHSHRLLDLLDEAGLESDVARLREVMSEETLRDPSQVKSIAEAKQLKLIYEEIFGRKTADEWEAILGLELCCIKVRSVEEWLQDSLTAGMTDACKLDDPVFGELLAPGPLVSSPEIVTEMRARTTDAGAFQQLLAHWNDEPPPLADAVEGSAPRNAGPPLEGLKVVDLSRIIAGPCAARVLAELGAEVISVQSPSRLDWALSFHLLFNAGKKSVTLDLRSEAGKQQFWAVMDAFQPDVFLQNYRHLDVAREAGVDPEALRARHPHITYTHLNAYGNHGVWKDRPGFEQVVQAVSGIQLAYARGGRPKLLPSPIIDIGCGLLGAFGSLLALYHRKRTGEGAFVTTHLTSMSVLLQLPQVAAMQRRACLARAKERDIEVTYDPDREVVAGILSSFGVAALLAGPRRQLRRWLVSSGVAANGEAIAGRELETAQKRFSWLLWPQWRRSLERAGLAGTIALLPYPTVRNVVEVMASHDRGAKPFIFRRGYPGCSQPLAFMRSPIRFSLSRLPDIAAPSVRGADTAEILATIGQQVARDDGVIPYPPNKPLAVWLTSFVRWGYFAWKSGNI